jgi:hypothetical protein
MRKKKAPAANRRGQEPLETRGKLSVVNTATVEDQR